MLQPNSGSASSIGNLETCQARAPQSSDQQQQQQSSSTYSSQVMSLPMEISPPLVSHLEFNNTDPVYSIRDDRIPLIYCSDKFVLNDLARMMKSISPQRRIISACSRNCTTNNYVITDDFKCYSHNVKKDDLHVSEQQPATSSSPNASPRTNLVKSSSNIFDVASNVGNAFNLRVYQAAAGYNHTALLVDRLYEQNPIDSEHKVIHSASYPSATKYHSLPNGETVVVPELCSMVCLFSSVSNFTESLIVGGSHAVNIHTGKMIHSAHDAHNIGLNRDLIWLTSLEQALEENEYVTFLSSAAFTIVAVTNRGHLLGIGCNDFGDIGLPKSVKQQRTFKRIPSPSNEFFVKTCCGDHNIAALTKDGKLYVTGCNFSNELGVSASCSYGLTHCKNVDTPSDPIVDIACEYYKIYILKKSNTLWTIQDGKVVPIAFSKRFLSSFPHPPTINIECLSATASSIQIIAHVTSGPHSYRFLMSNSLDRDLIINAISDISSIYHSSNEYANNSHSQQYQLCSTAYTGFFFWKPRYHAKSEELFKKQLLAQTCSPNSRYLCNVAVMCKEW
ncbi:hypothetical protein C9374_012415 [Naegleria lovaniensis]|uniref:Uncharacterized protein n=1 Tax=Naegleria lovaniensis TaxID=51637 RepID=A0AA88GW73_NAELO|nr:uncharacterized protein C9374_012415 [Naegleria lovaniensis]KAG2392163.1 hypothetical protein C9374_012415 [Naegleria lovaniensis]